MKKWLEAKQTRSKQIAWDFRKCIFYQARFVVVLAVASDGA